jgi:hypothetical protein
LDGDVFFAGHATIPPLLDRVASRSMASCEAITIALTTTDAQPRANAKAAISETKTARRSPLERGACS